MTTGVPRFGESNETHFPVKGKEISNIDDLKAFMQSILPVDGDGSVFLERTHEIVISSSRAFMPNVRKDLEKVGMQLKADGRFKNFVREEREIQAELVIPVGEITKIIFHVDKDM